MNDTFYEQIVHRKTRPVDIALRCLIVLVILAVAIWGFMFIGIYSFFLAMVLAVAAYYFAFPRLKVEFEYSLVNHELDIDIIYSKESRKHKISFDIQSAEIIAPQNSPRLRSYHPAKILDFTSGRKDKTVYAIMTTTEHKSSCILIEPDEEMVEHMKPWMGTKMYMD